MALVVGQNGHGVPGNQNRQNLPNGAGEIYVSLEVAERAMRGAAQMARMETQDALHAQNLTIGALQTQTRLQQTQINILNTILEIQNRELGRRRSPCSSCVLL